MRFRAWDTLTGRMLVLMATALTLSQVLALTILQSNLDTVIKQSIHTAQVAHIGQILRQVRVAAATGGDVRDAADHLSVVGAELADAPFIIPGARPEADLAALLHRRAGLPETIEVRVWNAGLETVGRRMLPDSSAGIPDNPLYGFLYCAVEIEPGRWLTFIVRPLPRFWPPPAPILLLLATSLVMVTLAAGIAARRLARPFRIFTTAAERLGAGERHEPVPVSGPIDVRRAQTAFNVMAARLQATSSSQQALLGAIGHDLRTPLTSLRVRTELLGDDKERARMTRALDELQRLTEAALQAAKGVPAGESARLIDMVGLVGAVCDDLADLGHPVAFEEPDARPIVHGWPEELTRAVRNIVENAVRYGERATVRIEEVAEACRILIEDEGPGIPEADQERVFDPLVRLESSRSAATGGHGLGLHIAHNTVAAHHGAIRLRNRSPRGLAVTIELPLAEMG